MLTLTHPIVNVSVSEKRVDSDHVWVEDPSWFISVTMWDGTKPVYEHEHVDSPTHRYVKTTDAAVLEAYAAYLREQEAKREAARLEKEAQRVAIGKTVRVVKGRKVAVGTTGLVFWMR